jgi:hypothetical protein
MSVAAASPDSPAAPAKKGNPAEVRGARDIGPIDDDDEIAGENEEAEGPVQEIHETNKDELHISADALGQLAPVPDEANSLVQELQIESASLREQLAVAKKECVRLHAPAPSLTAAGPSVGSIVRGIGSAYRAAISAGPGRLVARDERVDEAALTSSVAGAPDTDVVPSAEEGCKDAARTTSPEVQAAGGSYAYISTTDQAKSPPLLYVSSPPASATPHHAEQGKRTPRQLGSTRAPDTNTPSPTNRDEEAHNDHGELQQETPRSGGACAYIPSVAADAASRSGSDLSPTERAGAAVSPPRTTSSSTGRRSPRPLLQQPDTPTDEATCTTSTISRAKQNHTNERDDDGGDDEERRPQPRDGGQ